MLKTLEHATLSALLAASLLAAIPAHADRDDDHCRHDIQKAQQKLEKAEHKYGEHSAQAEERRHHLDELRERCHMRDSDHDHDHDHDQR